MTEPKPPDQQSKGEPQSREERIEELLEKLGGSSREFSIFRDVLYEKYFRCGIEKDEYKVDLETLQGELNTHISSLLYDFARRYFSINPPSKNKLIWIEADDDIRELFWLTIAERWEKEVEILQKNISLGSRALAETLREAGLSQTSPLETPETHE